MDILRKCFLRQNLVPQLLIYNYGLRGKSLCCNFKFVIKTTGQGAQYNTKDIIWTHLAILGKFGSSLEDVDLFLSFASLMLNTSHFDQGLGVTLLLAEDCHTHLV